MEIFTILGMFFFCYELCELYYHCSSSKKEDHNELPVSAGAEPTKVIYTISEQAELENCASS